jgi:hypothetical protein
VVAVGFEQAELKVEREKEFEELRSAIARALSSQIAPKFLKRVEKAGIRIRDFDSVLAKSVLDQVDQRLAGSGGAKGLYAALPLSDQAQMKEFYLSRIEEVAPEVRAKFHKLYQYY